MKQIRLLIAPNAYKGSLNAGQVAQAMAAGARKVLPQAPLVLCPLSDGGPGLLETLKLAIQGSKVRTLRTSGPVGLPGTKVLASAWLSCPKRMAILESATGIGIEKLPGRRLRALASHSYALGELILAAYASGHRELWIGLGGSACTDGGTGMARALGWKFLDAKGKALGLGGGTLTALAQVVPPAQDPLPGLKVRVFCDITNPLNGPAGAARVYAPQKGASAAQVKQLAAGLERLGKHFGKSISSQPGAGAAGGLGAGLAYFLGAKLVPGAPEVLSIVAFDSKLKACDVVLTGEGRLDTQSLSGKLPWQVARSAFKAKKRCLILAGSLEATPALKRGLRGADLYSVTGAGITVRKAMAEPEEHLQRAVEKALTQMFLA